MGVVAVKKTGSSVTTKDKTIPTVSLVPVVVPAIAKSSQPAEVVSARPSSPPIVAKPKKKKKKRSKDEPRKIIPLKDRNFHPDLHCGVCEKAESDPCTRSLTCKTHSIALRRAVPGRSHPFDTLLATHKKAKEEERQALKLNSIQTSSSSGSVPAPPPPVLISTSLSTSRIVPSVTTSSASLQVRIF